MKPPRWRGLGLADFLKVGDEPVVEFGEAVELAFGFYGFGQEAFDGIGQFLVEEAVGALGEDALVVDGGPVSFVDFVGVGIVAEFEEALAHEIFGIAAQDALASEQQDGGGGGLDAVVVPFDLQSHGDEFGGSLEGGER